MIPLKLGDKRARMAWRTGRLRSMSPSIRPHRPLLVIALATALAACGDNAPPPNPSAILAEVEAASNHQAVAPAAQAAPPRPIPPLQITETVPVERPLSHGVEPNPVLDASSPDALVRSLQAAEQQVSTQRADALKAALMVMQMRAAIRYKQIALRDPRAANFSDEKLFEIAFGDVHGRTVMEVIAEGERLLPTVVDSQGNPL